MSKRIRNRWLALVLGLGLGVVPFFGTADAAPSSRSNAHRSGSQTVGRRRPSHHGASRSSRSAHAHSSRTSRADRSGHAASRDPEIPEDDLSLTREHLLTTSASESIGRAARGRLLNGVPIEENAVVDVLANGETTAYGTSELVAMLEHAATQVASEHPGSILALGDLSRRGGGRLGSHRSHRSGRDADVGFYFLDEQGQPYPARYFVRFDQQGRGVTGWSHAEVQFDVARNWTLLESMIRFEGAELQYVFVTPALQELLLAEARRTGADPELIARASDLMSHHAGGHDNHFHVRIHCPTTDQQCIDSEPRRRSRTSHRGSARSSAHRAPARSSTHRAHARR